MIPVGAAALLVEARLAGADDVPALVRAHATSVAAFDATVYLVDREQVSLSPIGREIDPVPVEGTLPGAVFTSGVRRWSLQETRARLWMPLCDGVERLGLLALDYPEQLDDADEVDWLPRLNALMSAVAALLISKDPSGDLLERTRRSHTMSLAAEMQSALLPPRTFGTADVTVSCALEPAYDIGGDSFDYALNDGALHVALLDAMGHGLAAARLAGLGIAAYRHARRSGEPIDGIAAYLDGVIADEYAQERFITGWVGSLDVASGRLSYLNVGHPSALLLRSGSVVKELDAARVLPFGFGDTPDIATEALEPGDRLLVYTDGVVEARSKDHGFFGEERLIAFLEREAASGHQAPEILRRLTLAVLEHQEGDLQDDSSMVLIEWAGSR